MNEYKTQQNEAEMKGWLSKWTNYIKGYQKRWFVLTNGLLSYYRTQAEVAHTCRGTISLHGAVIHTEDSCNFVISNGGTQTFHLKASSEIERQRWVTALELAKAKAIRIMESEDEEDFEDMPMPTDKNELENVVKTLMAKLEDLSTCNDLIIKHGAALQRLLSEFEQLDSTSLDLSNKIKSVNERATLFRITSNAMMNACSEFSEMAQTQGRKWQRMLQHEHEQRLRLEEMVEQLARQHSHLEQAAKEATDAQNLPGQNKNHSDGEDEFFDAEGHDKDFTFNNSTSIHSLDVVDKYSNKYRTVKRQDVASSLRRTASGISIGSEGAGGMNDGVSSSGSDLENECQDAGVVTRKIKKAPGNGISQEEPNIYDGSSSSVNISLVNPDNVNKRKRRTCIPERPNYSINLWSIMKNCIGKDLTKIPMPVNFSEPLSMLQRLTEDFEYSEILDRAAECEDNCEQLAYVAAFTVSPYATTSNRTGKPFNPLLGETYECDRRDDLGWWSLSEQVSHHPPMAAQYCSGRGWNCWQEFTMSSKFRGKYLQVIPLGIAHLHFPKSGNHYTWRKVTTTVHNIIVGKLWVDQHGEMDIINHTTGDKCHLKYVPYSYFSREIPRKVTGIVADADGTVHWALSGTWDNKLEAAKVLNSSVDIKGKQRLETGLPKVLWKRRWPSPEYEKLYSFTELAVQLNEEEEGVAPTDTRNRPDQRLMENALWDEANQEKVRLEEKQRAARRKREQEAEQAAAEGRPYPGYEPVWFKKQKDRVTGNPIHMYQGKYLLAKEAQDWSMSPDIF